LRSSNLSFADLLRAGAFLGLAVIPSYGGTVALALIAGVGTAMFRPTANAALPGMVTDEQRSAATALYGANFSIGMTVGPALTALVALFGSPSAMLAVNGATFIVSALLLSSISFGAGARSPAASEPESGRVSLWASTVDGARSVAQRPGVPMLLVIGAAAILAGALMNVAEPMLATGPLRAGNSGYSLLVTAYGGAMAIASLPSARAGSSVAWLRRCFVIGLALQGVGMIASSLAPSLAWAIGSFALTGASNGLLAGPEIRLLQELAGDRLLGRTFGLRDMVGNVAYVLAFLGAGAVLGALGIRAVFAVGGAGLVALALVASLRFRPVRPAPGVSAESLTVIAEAA
jgi:MFS family permease